MSVQSAKSRFHFELPSLSYVDASWEEPNLRLPDSNCVPARRSGVGGWLASQMDGFRTWRRDRDAAAELSMMSDYELTDIGISRSDLNRVFDPHFNVDLRQRNGGA